MTIPLHDDAGRPRRGLIRELHRDQFVLLDDGRARVVEQFRSGDDADLCRHWPEVLLGGLNCLHDPAFDPSQITWIDAAHKWARPPKPHRIRSMMIVRAA